MKNDKGKFILFIITLFLSNVVMMHDYVLLPVINNIYEAFPNKQNIVNFIVSGPQLIGVITALLCGPLMKKISKKMILVWSYAVFSVAGILGVLIIDPTYMAVMRGIVGASMGFVNVAAVTVLAEAFTDENKRSKYLGFNNAALAGVGAAMSAIAGNLALHGWTEVFKVFWVAVPITAMLLFFIPRDKIGESDVSSEDSNEKINLKKYIPFCLSLLLFVAVYMVIQYMISVYVAEHALGNEAYTGYCGALATILSAVCAALFGFTYSKLKRASVIPSYIIYALGYLALYFFPTPAIGLIVSALLGGAFGNGFAYFFMDCTVLVPESKVGISISIVTAVQGFGMFIATYFAFFLEGLIKTDSVTDIFPILAGLSVVGIIYSVFAARRKEV